VVDRTLINNLFEPVASLTIHFCLYIVDFILWILTPSISPVWPGDCGSRSLMAWFWVLWILVSLNNWDWCGAEAVAFFWFGWRLVSWLRLGVLSNFLNIPNRWRCLIMNQWTLIIILKSGRIIKTRANAFNILVWLRTSNILQSVTGTGLQRLFFRLYYVHHIFQLLYYLWKPCFDNQQ